MDLLEIILRTCESEEYLENFKEHSIDCFTLKILDEQDLILLGIDSAEKRESILKHVSNFQTPGEKKISTVIDETYILLVLNQISLQMHKHYANLICAHKREDMDLCNIELSPAVKSLESVLGSFENVLKDFRGQVIGKNRKSKKLPPVIFPVLLVTVFAFYMCKKCILS